MARPKRQREQHRTSVTDVDGNERASIIIPIESIDWDEQPNLRLKQFKRWFSPVATWPASELPRAEASASIVVDPFQFVLYLSTPDGGCQIGGTHDGERFLTLAAADGADVYITAELDVRRSKPNDFADAATDGRVIGARVSAYTVDALE